MAFKSSIIYRDIVSSLEALLPLPTMKQLTVAGPNGSMVKKEFPIVYCAELPDTYDPFSSSKTDEYVTILAYALHAEIDSGLLAINPEDDFHERQIFWFSSPKNIISNYVPQGNKATMVWAFQHQEQMAYPQFFVNEKPLFEMTIHLSTLEAVGTLNDRLRTFVGTANEDGSVIPGPTSTSGTAQQVTISKPLEEVTNVKKLTTMDQTFADAGVKRPLAVFNMFTKAGMATG